MGCGARRRAAPRRARPRAPPPTSAGSTPSSPPSPTSRPTGSSTCAPRPARATSACGAAGAARRWGRAAAACPSTTWKASTPSTTPGSPTRASWRVVSCAPRAAPGARRARAAASSRRRRSSRAARPPASWTWAPAWRPRRGRIPPPACRSRLKSRGRCAPFGAAGADPDPDPAPGVQPDVQPQPQPHPCRQVYYLDAGRQAGLHASCDGTPALVLDCDRDIDLTADTEAKAHYGRQVRAYFEYVKRVRATRAAASGLSGAPASSAPRAIRATPADVERMLAAMGGGVGGGRGR